MRKLILNIATSLDGYISDPNGGFDWIVGHGDDQVNAAEAYDFEVFTKTIDTIVMGAAAYEDCIVSGLANFEGKQIIVATSRDFPQREGVVFVKSDICGYVEGLKSETGKDIWHFGGAQLADALVEKDLIDVYVIAIVPTILGAGRRLFSRQSPKIDLHLDRLDTSDGVTVFTYSKR